MQNLKLIKGSIAIYAVLIVIIVASIALGFGEVPHGNYKVLPPGRVVDNSALSINKNVQLRSLDYITDAPTPTTAVPTAAPLTPSPTTTLTPTPEIGDIDFSSGFLDWEDVTVIITKAGALSSLSSTCNSELHKAEAVEYGETNGNVNAGAQPGSRALLCIRDPACEAYGFDHYHGTLPSYAPSAACQKPIADVFHASEAALKSSTRTDIQTQKLIKQAEYDIHNPHATNCDSSEGYQSADTGAYLNWICDQVIAQPDLN